MDFAKRHPELKVKGTFFDDAVERRDLMWQRALSEGAKPRSQGTWSVGTEKNHKRNPSQCHIMKFFTMEILICSGRHRSWFEQKNCLCYYLGTRSGMFPVPDIRETFHEGRLPRTLSLALSRT